MKKMLFAMMLGIFCLTFGGWSGVKKNTSDTKREPVEIVDVVEEEWDWGRAIREIYSDGTEIEAIAYYGENMGQSPRKVERFYKNGLCMRETSFNDNLDPYEEIEFSYDENGNVSGRYTKWMDGTSVLEEIKDDLIKSTFCNSDGSRLESFDDKNNERVRSIYYYPLTSGNVGRRETVYKESLVWMVYTYDRDDKLLSREEYSYDKNGELEKCVYYDGDGKVTAIEDIPGEKTYYSEFSYWISQNHVFGFGGILFVIVVAFGVFLIYSRRKKSE